MLVTFISQCEKKALPRTRRVLDAFADRIGERTWQTTMTEEGLIAVKKLLRRTASKSTAVACHWARGHNRTDLLWIVGNRNQFNSEGIVPVNRTQRKVLPDELENWYSYRFMQTVTRMAALFHDFGKASQIFATKLANAVSGTSAAQADPFRHEWISLRMFEAFVRFHQKDQPGDEKWLGALSEVNSATKPDFSFMDGMIIDQTAETLNETAPFTSLAPYPVAQLIAWLIVSHHRLPTPQKNLHARHKNRILHRLNHKWAGSNEQTGLTEANNWKFDRRHPFYSQTWRKEAAGCALKLVRLGEQTRHPATINDPYFAHISRLALMLADHYYSSAAPTSKWHDKNYTAYANTTRPKYDQKGRLIQPSVYHQFLDDHLIGVNRNTMEVFRALNQRENLFDGLDRNRQLEEHTTTDRFLWQNRAYDACKKIQAESEKNGFFGVNLASTGFGKTLGNARIMYALGNPEHGARFNVAIGLRSLTLQTGQELRTKLKLDDDELAIMVGGGAVRELFEANMADSTTDDNNLAEQTPLVSQSMAAMMGSESLAGLGDMDSWVDFSGSLPTGHMLAKWLKQHPDIHKMLTAPALVCTVDHLTPATESTRGGRQIAPMLRLMTSDLIIDEPDDFGPNDWYALARLVNWAGLMGSRVLLSSATLTPSEVNGLFEAYKAGRQFYNFHHFAQNQQPGHILCGWFDEKLDPAIAKIPFAVTPDAPSFASVHKSFSRDRVNHLIHTSEKSKKRHLQWVDTTGANRQNWPQQLGRQILETAIVAHQHNAITDPVTHKNYSVGLVRMAHIDNLALVAQQLNAMSIAPDTRLHVCVYHSRFPLLMRSQLEKQLDTLLNRNQQQPHQHPLLKTWLAEFPEQNHIVMVLASPVAEVGRDHDYDWMIVEPSSMRSIIQIAGRLRRHRHEPWSQPNFFLLNHNIAQIKSPGNICFTKPGYESDDIRFKAEQYHLEQLIKGSDRDLDARPRLRPPVRPAGLVGYQSLVEIEHERMMQILLGKSMDKSVNQRIADDSLKKRYIAPDFWQLPLHLTGVLQKDTNLRFRKEEPAGSCCFKAAAADDVPELYQLNDRTANWANRQYRVTPVKLPANPQLHWWNSQPPENVLQQWLDKHPNKYNWEANCKRFLSVNLPAPRDWSTPEIEPVNWHPALGFFRG